MTKQASFLKAYRDFLVIFADWASDPIALDDYLTRIVASIDGKPPNYTFEGCKIADSKGGCLVGNPIGSIVGHAKGDPVTYQTPLPAGGVQMETFLPWTLVRRGLKKQVITPLDAGHTVQMLAEPGDTFEDRLYSVRNVQPVSHTINLHSNRDGSNLSRPHQRTFMNCIARIRIQSSLHRDDQEPFSVRSSDVIIRPRSVCLAHLPEYHAGRA